MWNKPGLIAIAGALVVVACSCSTPPPRRTLTMVEQIAEDNHAVHELQIQFEKRAEFENRADLEKYLTALARKLAQVQEGFPSQSIRVRIHKDKNPAQSKFFSFPGTMVSVPESALKQIEYENELAAAIAFELSNVLARHLAHKIESHVSAILFGDGSIFNLDRGERAESIGLGTKMMYYAGYDLRGMASVFQRYPDFFSGLTGKNEVEFNVKESQRVRSGFLPARDPVVRSPEFIRFKKLLKK